MNYYEKIKTLCAEHNIKISALEKELGLGNGTISKWKNSVPKHDNLQKIADFFGVTVDSFYETKKSPPSFDGEQVAMTLSAEELEFISAIRQYGDNPVFQAALQGVISAFSFRRKDQAKANAEK